MDGRKPNGVALTSGLLVGGGSGGGTGNKDPVLQEGLDLYLGPNGSSRRNWRFRISPLTTDTNALIIQYKDKTGVWQSSQVFLAHEN